MGEIPSNIGPSTTLGDVVLMCLKGLDMNGYLPSITTALVIYFGDDAWNKGFDLGMESVKANRKTSRKVMAQFATDQHIDKRLCSLIACTLERTYERRRGEATGGDTAGFTEQETTLINDTAPSRYLEPHPEPSGMLPGLFDPYAANWTPHRVILFGRPLTRTLLR